MSAPHPAFVRAPFMQRGEPFEMTVNGRPVQAYPGESVAAALLAAGVRAFRASARTGAPRGPYCAMGVCFDCLVTVDGQPNVRGCATPARPGLRVELSADADDD